jgi:hypothetical protein
VNILEGEQFLPDFRKIAPNNRCISTRPRQVRERVSMKPSDAEIDFALVPGPGADDRLRRVAERGQRRLAPGGAA